MKYLEYYNTIKKLEDHSIVLFMDFRHMDEDDPDRDQIEDQISDLGNQRKALEDELYAKYGCGVDRIMIQNTKRFTEAVDEAVQLRDLWDQFDSSISILHPDIVHPIAGEMLLMSPKWFVHMNAPGVGEIHKRNVLKKYEVLEPISWSFGDDGNMIDAVYPDGLEFPNGASIKFSKQLTAPGVVGEQHLSGAEEHVTITNNYVGVDRVREAEKDLLKTFFKLDEEIQKRYFPFLEIEVRWIYLDDHYSCSHLFNMGTGYSCCGKANIRNTAITENMFPVDERIRCLLCEKSKIGRILKWVIQ